MREAKEMAGAGIVGIIRPGRIRLFRRVGGALHFWREIEGDRHSIADAVEAALLLDEAASDLGGWANALRLGLNPTVPVHNARVASGVFPQDQLNSRLRKP